MNSVFSTHKMLPHRQAAQLLTKELGDFLDWHFWLVDNRRYRNSPFIPYTRESKRVFYKLEDIQTFIAKRKAMSRIAKRVAA